MLKESSVGQKIVHSVAGDLGLLQRPASSLPDAIRELPELEVAPADLPVDTGSDASDDGLDEIESMLDRLEQK